MVISWEIDKPVQKTTSPTSFVLKTFENITDREKKTFSERKISYRTNRVCVTKFEKKQILGKEDAVRKRQSFFQKS